jgi:hypothetical protein
MTVCGGGGGGGGGGMATILEEKLYHGGMFARSNTQIYLISTYNLPRL